MEKKNLSFHVTAEISLDVPGELLNVIEGSLIPEVKKPTYDRSNVDVITEEGKLLIQIQASDVAALRATINSYLHWVGAILDVVDSI